MESAQKNDQDKPKMDLLYSGFLFGIANVLTFGAIKYAAWNWAKGMNYSRAYAALMRHMWAWHSGEELDPESGLHHLDHAGCELMFLRGMVDKRPDLDDRFKWVTLIPETLEILKQHELQRNAINAAYLKKDT